MHENSQIELKLRVTDSAMPAVSAFANFGDGSIGFGFDDATGEAQGLSDIEGARLALEKKIRDTMEPMPDYRLEEDPSTNTLWLHVKKGNRGPYLYRGAAYKRVDTASVRLGPWDLAELARKMSPVPYGMQLSREQNLTFHELAEAYARVPGVRLSEVDLCKTLSLGTQGSFNNTAALLADKAQVPGASIVVFDQDRTLIKRREDVHGVGVLSIYKRAMVARSELYDGERIEGSLRVPVQLIPEAAFREAIVNALAHRDWSVGAQLSVQLEEDKATITSPGGLPQGVTQEEYLQGRISVLRNERLAVALLQLGLLEHLGGGVERMRAAYEGTGFEPSFEFTEGSVTVVLPVLNQERQETSDVLALFKPGSTFTRREVQTALGWSQGKASAELRSLEEQGLLERIGQGRSTAFRRL